MSALLRDGPTRRAFFETGAALFAPFELQEEIERHLLTNSERAGVPLPELRVILASLLGRIEWVPRSTYLPDLDRALRALSLVDLDDVPYLACALAVGADAIWSLDLDFDQQSLVPRIPHPDARVE